MRRNELDYLLSTLLDFNKDVSDIIFTVDRPPQVEVGNAGDLCVEFAEHDRVRAALRKDVDTKARAIGEGV